ncbi:alpha-L-rhamnosidase C-terminal domain-containing protein [Nocardiopsis sp. MG754419]|uniref:alpha-L-rhamnosidase C-terminal domain-containing protein n=1 Tax=Nocardiopsis sp. MG754419 TaxID=2259865 RepID=UPI00201278D9|nr:alpha-L-rhamnosidase C-terminal domain-containing protein [Nocardiopsis sp. MG754419]
MTMTPTAEELSRTSLPEDDAWRALVVLPDAPLIGPAEVTVEDDLQGVGVPCTRGGPGTGVGEGNAGKARVSRLLAEGGPSLTLRTRARHSASVIVDLGLLAMGYLEVVVQRISGAPLRVAHAQFRDQLSPKGDGLQAFFGTDAAPWSRVDLFSPRDTPATLVSEGKRETRYLLLTLDGPGEAVIDRVRVRSTVYPVRRDGHFLSSDGLLNRAWHHSAHSGDLASVSEDSDLPGAPEGPSPWMLTAPFDRILFMGDLHMQALAGYQQSGDYRRLVRHSLRQFGWVQNPDGSFPLAVSHLVHGDAEHPVEPGPPTGWRVPENGPDPDLALGYVGDGISLFHDVTIHSFTAFWVAALADHYLYTGDAAFVRPLLPVARRAIAFLSNRTDADGLFREQHDRRTDPDAPLALVANWSPLDLAVGVDSLTNAVLHRALQGLAELERNLAEAPDAALRLDEQAERVRRALLERLWDARTGAMVLNSDDPTRDHTGDANAGNLVFGTLDADRARRVMEFLGTKLATPYGTRSSEFEDNPYRASDIQGYVQALEALGRVRHGDTPGALDLIRRWWGHMLDEGPGTGWFAWQTDGTRRHGDYASTPWTTAVPALTEGVLGVRPTGPGYRRWRVAPEPADLAWAQGRVPTPGGGLAVRWARARVLRVGLDTDSGARAATGGGAIEARGARTGVSKGAESDASLGAAAAGDPATEPIEESFVLTVEPSEGEGEVVVPLLGRPRRIAVDGLLRWDGEGPVNTSGGTPDGPRSRGDAVVFTGVTGAHTFAWSGPNHE